MPCFSKPGHQLLPKTYLKCPHSILKLLFCVFGEFSHSKNFFLSSLDFLFIAIFLDRKKKVKICLI